MSIEDEIGQAVFDTGVLRFPGDRHALVAVVMPLVKRAQAEAWNQGAGAAWERSTPEVNGQGYRWRTSGEPRNPYAENEGAGAHD